MGTASALVRPHVECGKGDVPARVLLHKVLADAARPAFTEPLLSSSVNVFWSHIKGSKEDRQFVTASFLLLACRAQHIAVVDGAAPAAAQDLHIVGQAPGVEVRARPVRIKETLLAHRNLPHHQHTRWAHVLTHPAYLHKVCVESIIAHTAMHFQLIC